MYMGVLISMSGLLRLVLKARVNDIVAEVFRSRRKSSEFDVDFICRAQGTEMCPLDGPEYDKISFKISICSGDLLSAARS